MSGTKPTTCQGRRSHSTSTDYFMGCRCPEATRAVAVYEKRRRLARIEGRALTVPACGVQRRLRALAAIGWSFPELASRLGVTSDAVSDWARVQRGFMFRTTADRIATLYDELSMTPGPSKIAQARASRKGWPPPLAWDDDEIDDPKARPRRNPRVERYGLIDPVAVEEAIAGRVVRLTDEERREVVRRLSARGLNARQIADRLGTSMKTVQRFRSRIAVRDAA